MAGPSGAGKTYSALLIASGIVPLEKVAVIDTESGSADLYADLGGYSTVTISPPYSPKKYIEAIHAAEEAGFELVIIDSLSHAWSGEGGLLDQQGKAADSKYRGNSWAAWREITPLHNQLVETMLHTPLHVIVTMRSKTEYVQTEVNGRKKIEKVGMAPIQRDGIEYEFTTVLIFRRITRRRSVRTGQSYSTGSISHLRRNAAKRSCSGLMRETFRRCLPPLKKQNP